MYDFISALVLLRQNHRNKKRFSKAFGSSSSIMYVHISTYEKEVRTSYKLDFCTQVVLLVVLLLSFLLFLLDSNKRG